MNVDWIIYYTIVSLICMYGTESDAVDKYERLGRNLTMILGTCFGILLPVALSHEIATPYWATYVTIFLSVTTIGPIALFILWIFPAIFAINVFRSVYGKEYLAL